MRERERESECARAQEQERERERARAREREGGRARERGVVCRQRCKPLSTTSGLSRTLTTVTIVRHTSRVKMIVKKYSKTCKIADVLE